MATPSISARILGLIEMIDGHLNVIFAGREIDRERLAEVENRLAALDRGMDAGEATDRARAAVLARGGRHAETIRQHAGARSGDRRP